MTALPVDFGQLKTLQTLRLDENQMTALPENSGQLKTLRTLRLDENPGKVWATIDSCTTKVATSLHNCSRGFYCDHQEALGNFLDHACTLAATGICVAEGMARDFLVAVL